MQKGITTDILMTISATIEALLIEQQEGIAKGYNEIPDFKLSIVVTLDPTSKGVEADYTLTYALEAPREPVVKAKVQKHQVLTGNQEELPLDDLTKNPKIVQAVKNLIPKKGSGIDSVTFTDCGTGKSVTLEAQ